MGTTLIKTIPSTILGDYKKDAANTSLQQRELQLWYRIVGMKNEEQVTEVS